MHTHISYKQKLLFWMRLIAPQHLFNFILSVSFFKQKDSLTEISDSLPPHYLFRSYIFSLYSNALLLRKCESRELFGIISVSPWVCAELKYSVAKSLMWTSENSRMHTHLLLTLKCVIPARAAYSCIFIFSSGVSSKHYRQLIRCKAELERGKIH